MGCHLWTVIGDLLRDLRLAGGYSQKDLSRMLFERTGRTVERDKLSRWENGGVIPGPFWLTHLAPILDVPLAVLKAEATLSRVDRRAFISPAALAATYGKVASDVASSLAARDPGVLAAVQTTHGTDLAIAHELAGDKAATAHLRRWMTDGESGLLRVNAAGILAKIPSQSSAETVTRALANDPDTRLLYVTAVVARVGSLDWSAAERITANAGAVDARQARFLAARLAAESVNPRDAGARWCSAVMLRDLSPLLSREDESNARV